MVTRYNVKEQERFRKNGRIHLVEYPGAIHIIAEYASGESILLDVIRSRVTALIMARKEAVKRQLAFNPYQDWD